MNLAPTDPLAVPLTAAVHSGELDDLRRLLEEQPELANVRIGGRGGGWRTPLHVATDWPGYFPNGPEVVRLLIESGADPSAPCEDGPSETPLHWAASSDDLEVAAALIDGGADIEALGASIAGGDPLDNAVGYGCWHVARLLVDRAFYQACHGGQLRMAALLLERGADINTTPDYGHGQTPLDIAGSTDTRRGQLVSWPRERGALASEKPT